MRVLIKTYGFIGDILFASSVAEKLKNQGVAQVDYCIGFPQPYELLKNNPFIDHVFLSKNKGPRVQLPDHVMEITYDAIYELPECRQDTPPTILFQQYCGVHTPTSEYTIYTNPILDESVRYELDIFNSLNAKVVGFVANWKQLTIRYTKEEYYSGLENVRDIMSHTQVNTRNIEYIINEIGKECIMIPLGYDSGVTQYHTSLDSTSTYSNTASIIKMCDLVIGQEGGLTNLAAGVGTRCVITTDFMYALYGPRGIMKRYDEIKLGPKNLFPNMNHIHVSPFATDNELLTIIKKQL